MRIRKLLPVVVLAMAGFVSRRGVAYRMVSPQVSPESAAAAELDPVIINLSDPDAKPEEVVLSIDLDNKGEVSHAKAISGQKDRMTPAIANAKWFRYPDRAGQSGLTQHILFRSSKDEVRTVAPEFPHIAARAHAGGLVQLIATVDPQGRVTDVTFLSGGPLVRNDSENALRQWVFTPVVRNGSPVGFHAVVRFNFNLPPGPH